MDTSMRTETIEVAALPQCSMSVDIPTGWQPMPLGEVDRPEIAAAFGDARSLNPGFTTNVVVLGVEVRTDTDLRTWQGGTLQVQMSTVPDFHLVENRLDNSGNAPTWYRVYLATGDQQTTQITREWHRIVSGHGLSLVITTVPGVEGKHGDLLDSIGASWRTETSEGEQ